MIFWGLQYEENQECCVGLCWILFPVNECCRNEDFGWSNIDFHHCISLTTMDYNKWEFPHLIIKNGNVCKASVLKCPVS